MTSISIPNDPSAEFGSKQTTISDVLRRVLAPLMDERATAAERAVSAHLAAQSDGRLAGLGFSAGEISAIRAGEPVNRILGRR